MKANAKKAHIYLLIIGIVLILAGLIIQIPGGALTTYKSLNGDKTDNYYFDDKYSTIDEYVGGDAYNYIIGASLVAGKTAGAMASKAICFVGGAVCCGLSLTIKALGKEDTSEDNNAANDENSGSGSSDDPDVETDAAQTE